MLSANRETEPMVMATTNSIPKHPRFSNATRRTTRPSPASEIAEGILSGLLVSAVMAYIPSARPRDVPTTARLANYETAGRNDDAHNPIAGRDRRPVSRRMGGRGERG